MDYELQNVSAFFQSKSQRVSHIFMCHSCPWSIKLKVNEKQERYKRSTRFVQHDYRTVQYLGFYLQCHRDRNEGSPWSINVLCDLILLDPVSGIVMKQHRYPFRFYSDSGTSGV